MAAYQNSFYLNALGAKGDFKDGTNPKIYGAILGYDRMIDDLLIGGYFSYTIQKLKISSLIAMSMNLAFILDIF
ncbi:autotransporter domain-containing protein [Campylobacter devanensis]|uniref:autotransporter domain-containing protein n=2 Tax=Campylobacter devanensis TaxID=3161138 RepID=UPI000A34609B|nr:autotransporter domain-containing protein [Campylobacter sp. P0132]